MRQEYLNYLNSRRKDFICFNLKKCIKENKFDRLETTLGIIKNMGLTGELKIIYCKTEALLRDYKLNKIRD